MDADASPPSAPRATTTTVAAGVLLIASAVTYLAAWEYGYWVPDWALGAQNAASVLPGVPPLLGAAVLATWGPPKHRRSLLMAMALVSVVQWVWAGVLAGAFVEYLRSWEGG